MCGCYRKIIFWPLGAANTQEQQEVKQYAGEILSLVRDPIQFPRSVTEEGFNLTKLFVFADASSCSLAVVLYGLFTNQEGEKKTALLNAKHAMVSRTIPQNELWALVAANRLLHNYINACDTEFLEQAAILSDSKCCLEMIKPTYLAKDVYTKNKIPTAVAALVPIKCTNNAIAKHLLISAKKNVMMILIVKDTLGTEILIVKLQQHLFVLPQMAALNSKTEMLPIPSI